MKAYVLLILIILTSIFIGYSQEKLEIEGAIVLKNSENPAPIPGTIRFNPDNNDFEGWNGKRWMSLSRLSEPGEAIIDIDGNYYRTVHLGSQHWMAENLKVTQLNDLVPMFEIQNDAVWSGLITRGWCYYGNDESNNVNYGKLYNWYAVNTGKLCPSGWHVPSYHEWIMLIDHLGGAQIAGGKMKETGSRFWDSPRTGATNESGFTSLAGGFRNSTGEFIAKGEDGRWWSSSAANNDDAYSFYLQNYHTIVVDKLLHKRHGFSVRCVKD